MHTVTAQLTSHAGSIWTEIDLIALHETMLLQTLAHLRDERCSKETREEAFEWLTSEATAPFSFRACCAVLRLDYEDVREGVLYRLIRLPVGACFRAFVQRH